MSFDTNRQLILDSITSDGSESNGLIAELANVPVTAVVRTSDTVITITLPALPGYDITSPEVITATVPNEVLAASVLDVVATPTFEIEPLLTPSKLSQAQGVSSPTLAQNHILQVGGLTQFSSLGEPTVGQSFSLSAQHLTSSQGITDVGFYLPFENFRRLILDNITSDGSEPNGLVAELANISVSAVVRTSNTVITITLPVLPGYNITAEETLTATIPNEVLVGGTQDVIGTPTFAITLDLTPQLGVDSLSQGQGLTTADLLQHATLTTQSLTLSQTIELVQFIQANSLAIQGAVSAQVVELVGLSQNNILSVNGLQEANQIGNVDIVSRSSLPTENLLQGETTTVAALLQRNVLNAEGISSLQGLQGTVVVFSNVLLVDNISQAELISIAYFGALLVLELVGNLDLYPITSASQDIHPLLSGKVTT